MRGREAGCEAGSERLISPQHEVKPAASLRRSAVGGRGGAEPVPQGRRPWTASLVLEPMLMNLPAQGAWNGQKGVLGTGEILLGPVLWGRVAVLPITDGPGKW